MTLLRKWKAERPEGGEHKICIFFFQIAVAGGKELGTNKG